MFTVAMEEKSLGPPARNAVRTAHSDSRLSVHREAISLPSPPPAPVFPLPFTESTATMKANIFYISPLALLTAEATHK